MRARLRPWCSPPTTAPLSPKISRPRSPTWCRVGEIDGVEKTIDPFTTTSERADQEQKLADGATQLDDAEQQAADGQAQLDAAQAQLKDGQAQLDAGQQQLDAAIAQAQAAGAYDQAAAQFEAQQAQIDAQQAQLDAGQEELTAQQTKIDDGNAEIATQRAQLEDGKTLLTAASDIRTVNEAGTVALGAIAFTVDQFSLSSELKAEVAATLDDADIDGITIDYSATIAQSIDGLIGPGEIIGVSLALIILIIMFRALLPALLPLVSSLLAVGTGVIGALAFSGAVEMNSVTPALGVMLGLAVGIDYALFIVNRHRRQVQAGMDLKESIALANGTSGSAVVFAGSTVLVALLALNVTGIPFLGTMGTVGAVCVLLAVLVAVSFTPAVLGLLGIRVLSRRARREIGHESRAEKPLKEMKTGRSIVTVVVAVVALLIIAIPALSMRLGLPDGSSEATDTTAYRTYTAVADNFGAGQNGALVVTAQVQQPVDEDAVAQTQAAFAAQLMDVDDVVAVAPIGVSDDRDFFASRSSPPMGPQANRRSSSSTICAECPPSRRRRVRSHSASRALPAVASTSRRSSRTPCRSTC